MIFNCILAGVGGQGTVLASKLIAQAAMNKGLNVRTAETIGMAQRGGCVLSHVRFGKNIHSSMIPRHSADILIGFEPAEAVRCLSYLKKGGMVVVSDKAIKPVTSSLSNTDYSAAPMLSYLKEQAEHVVVVDTDKICADCGSAKVLNVALLGAACASGKLGMTVEDIEIAMEQRVAARFGKINRKALREGSQATEW
jgi:indolepyruvate ferredoxin oxidoreductase beta subunit